MAITAKDVKELREKTGAGMMDCKKALGECNGSIEEAVDFLRAKGLAAAQKKQSRIAAEGTVVSLVEGNNAVVLEVNCETDFVSKGDDFKAFANDIAMFALKDMPADVASLRTSRASDVNELTLKIGEKIDIRKMITVSTEGVIGNYNHGGKIGVLVDLNTTVKNTEVEELARDLAMHVAAANPTFLSAADIDEDFKKREAAIYETQLKEEGKPENMIPKIIQGKLNKLASEVCLLEQKFVKNPDLKIHKLIAEVASKVGGDIAVKNFFKLNLGEGIQKKEDNLADEVAKMTQG